MLSYRDLKPTPRLLRAFTSLDPEEFAMLLVPFEKAWQDYINRYYIHKKSRKRRYGGGRKPHLLAIEDKLLFIQYLRQNWLTSMGFCSRVELMSPLTSTLTLQEAHNGHFSTLAMPSTPCDSDNLPPMQP